MVRIAPSILTADLGHLASTLQAAQNAGVDALHLDVMDGQFVPNITFGPLVVRACREAVRLPIEVHAMITNPDVWIEPFVQAGTDRVTVHVESTPHVHRTLSLIRQHGAQAGVALNPGTPLEHLWPLLDVTDHVLVMSVNPGFGGQVFLPASAARVQAVRARLGELPRSVTLGVDGGINPQTVRLLAEAGADEVVCGSSVFNDRPVRDNVRAIRAAVQGQQDT